MSGSQQQGKIGRKRILDDHDNMPSKEETKRLKGREAAKRHREKKDNELSKMKEKNEQLKLEIDCFNTKLSEMDRMIVVARRLLQEHKEAGCCLPEDNQECESFTVHSPHNVVMSMDRSVSDYNWPTNGSSTRVVQESRLLSQDRLPNMMPDPKALFSGKSLPLHVEDESSARSQQAGDFQTGSPLVRRTLAREESDHNLPLLPCQAAPTSQSKPALVSCDDSQSAVSLAQEEQFTHASSTMSQHSQEVIAQGTAIRTIQPTTSAPVHFPLRQNMSQVLKRDGKPHRTIFNGNGNVLSEQINNTNSSMFRDEQGTNSTQICQEQRVEEEAQSSVLNGNIPATILSDNFDQLVHSSSSVDLYSNIPLDRVGNISWNGNQQISFSDEANLSLPQQETPNSVRYSYTNDLDMNNLNQNMYHVQDCSFQQQNEENGGMVLVTAHSPSSRSVLPAEGIQAPPHNTVVNVALPSSNSNFVTENEQYGNRSKFVNAPVTCATAMLDMLSQSELSSSLQNQIKASLDAGNCSNPQVKILFSGATEVNNFPIRSNQTSNTTGELLGLEAERIPSVNHTHVPNPDLGSRQMFQNQRGEDPHSGNFYGFDPNSASMVDILDEANDLW